MTNEEQLENLCLDWFRETGWEVFHGPDIAPDGANPARGNYSDVLLTEQLIAVFPAINKHIPSEAISICLEQVLAKLKQAESLDLITNNRAFHRLLLSGIPVDFKDGDKPVHDHAFLIDFENIAANRFQAINQFTVSGTKQPRRPDIVCFIDGLPMAVLELKSPSDENADIWDAFNPIQTYKKEISDLFIFNEALAISDGYTARVGSLTANQERFMPWRTIKDEDDKPLLECNWKQW